MEQFFDYGIVGSKSNNLRFAKELKISNYKKENSIATPKMSMIIVYLHGCACDHIFRCFYYKIIER